MVTFRRIKTATWYFWLYIAIFTATMLIFRFYSPTAQIYRHTYEISTPPGTLVSDRWSFDFVLESLFVLLWLIPISAGFMLTFPGIAAPTTIHLITLVLLGIWYMVALGFGIYDYVNANGTAPENYLNPANDPRWCCVYFNLPGAPCVNTVACVPGVGADMLTVNGTFLFRFWFNVVLILFIVFDFFYTLLVYKRATNDFLKESEVDSLYNPLMKRHNNNRGNLRKAYKV